MNIETFDFELVDKYAPATVIRNSLKQIEEATKGYVCGNIKEYGGHIYSYTKKVGLAAALGTFATGETVEVDIQNDLGVQDTKKNTYEVFLAVKGLEHYKYRLMFVDYGTVSYPAKIVLNEELAIEYTGKRNTLFEIRTMRELENMMDKIINSVFFIRLVQSLINESIRKEEEAQEVAKEICE